MAEPNPESAVAKKVVVENPGSSLQCSDPVRHAVLPISVQPALQSYNRVDKLSVVSK